MGKTQQTSTVLVGTAALLVVVGLIWVLVGFASENSWFGVILIGLGVVIGVTGWVMSHLRRG